MTVPVVRHSFLALEPLARTSEGSKSGPIGLAVILLLSIGCYFLFKSMSGHLRRVREEFPTGEQAGPPPAAPPAPRQVPGTPDTRAVSATGDEPPPPPAQGRGEL